MGAPEPRRGAGGLVVLPPSLKRVVPGSVPPWRAPCFAWPCRGFGLPGFFSWLRLGGTRIFFNVLSARLRAVETAFFDVGPTCCLCFPLARNFATGRLPLVPHCSLLAAAARAHGCCCSQPFASRRARLFLLHGFHRAPQIRFSKLRRQLVGAGPW